MPVRKIHKTIPVILIHIMVPGLMVVPNPAFMQRMLRHGLFPPGHPCHAKKPVDRVCLYTGFKLAFRIRPAVKCFGGGMNQKQAVATLYVISAILGLSAVVLTTSGEQKAMLFFAALCIVAVVYEIIK